MQYLSLLFEMNGLVCEAHHPPPHPLQPSCYPLREIPDRLVNPGLDGLKELKLTQIAGMLLKSYSMSAKVIFKSSLCLKVISQNVTKNEHKHAVRHMFSGVILKGDVF